MTILNSLIINSPMLKDVNNNIDTTTNRIYAKAQYAFYTWLHKEKLDYPATPADVARYLTDCWEKRGMWSVSLHLSAIASLYRSEDLSLDTKAASIAAVMKAAREEARLVKGQPPSTRRPGRQRITVEENHATD